MILQYIDPALMLTIHAVACSVFCLLTAELKGTAGVVCLFFLFYFESLSYPVIFTLGTKNLGRYTKWGSSLIVMGVGGGAWYPPAQAALADAAGTPRSYLVAMSGYLAMLIYAVGMVVVQSRTYGFRVRTYDEMEAMKIISAGASAFPPGALMFGEAQHLQHMEPIPMPEKASDHSTPTSPIDAEKRDVEYRETGLAV